MTTQASIPTPSPSANSSQLRCALTGRPLSADEAYWAPPLITLNELLTAVFRSGLRAPSQLGHILFAEQENVPYAPEARDLLARRRSTEQAKLLGLILLVLLALVGIVLALT